MEWRIIFKIKKKKKIIQCEVFVVFNVNKWPRSGGGPVAKSRVPI